ncbi:MAG: molybdenum cofactor biosynthesis protein MoaE [Pseudomonadota bacterium]
MPVRVQSEDFDLGREVTLLRAGITDAGALATFSGLVRDDGGLQAMELEHYPGMTEAALAELEAAAVTRWSLQAALIIHRHGRLNPGDQIMMVATLAPHRHAAFEAAEFLMDALKSRAPFWKKEHFATGEARWVAARDEDEDALTRWGER